MTVRTRVAIVVAAIAVGVAGCAVVRSPVPWRRTCADGWPIRILQDKTCPGGVCGYTCAPDRWRDPDPVFRNPN